MTGRKLRYKRALQVIQREEYLDAVDFGFLRRKKRQDDMGTIDPYMPTTIVPTTDNVPTTTVQIGNSSFDLLTGVRNIATSAVVVGTVFGVTNLILNPSPVKVLNSVPTNVPQPGTPQGGALPFTAAATTLALVPLGLTPIATFPPFATPRAFPAEAVIYSEFSAAPRRGKREINVGFSLQKNVSSNFWSFGSNFLRYLKKQFQCLPIRLSTSPTRATELRLKYPVNYANFEEDRTYKAENIADCIKGVGQPLYGFTVNVTILRDSPCIIGQTCRPSVALPRQTGEDFFSLAPPDCRVRRVPCF